MDAYAAEGNVAEGLRVFERLRTLLRDELGTTPSPDVIAAHERLLRPAGRPRARTAPTRQEREASIGLPAELRLRGAPPMVGRRHELDRAHATLAAVGAGKPGDPR